LRQELFDRAASLAKRQDLVEQSFRAEYTKFLAAISGWPREIDERQLLSVIDYGPAALHDSRRERLAQHDDTEENIDARAKEYLLAWQHRLLTAVGLDQLRGELRERLEALNQTEGVIDKPVERSIEIGAGGPDSPLTAVEMEGMSDETLLAHLAAWHPNPNDWHGPTHQGQGEILSESLASTPQRFIAHLDRVENLRPTYIRAVLRGWQLAVEADRAIPWEEALRLSRWAVRQNDQSAVEIEGHEFDDDDGFRNTKFQVAHLLGSSLRLIESAQAAIPAALLEAATDILLELASYPEPENEDERGKKNGSDPLTRSLNTVRPVAIRGLIYLVHRRPEALSAAVALDRLAAHISPGDPSLAVAAVFGEGTGRLYDGAKPWMLNHANALFGGVGPSTPAQQVALSTALAAYGYHPALLDLLREAMAVAIKEMNLDDRVTGWTGMRSFSQLLGDWILLAAVTGKISVNDELLLLWQGHADAKARGDVLGHLGWQMMHWTSVEPDTMSRAVLAWESRVSFVREHPDDAAELADFYWYVRSGKFPTAWWLPRLLEVTELEPAFKTHGMIGEQLAAAAPDDPGMALAVLENLLRDTSAQSQMTHYDLDENAIPQVLAVALESGSAELASRADVLMNLLAAGGYLDLEERVKSRRQTLQ